MPLIAFPDPVTTAIKNCIDFCVCAYFNMLTSPIRVMYNTKRFQETVDLSDEAAGGEVVAGEEGVETGGEADEASGCC